MADAAVKQQPGMRSILRWAAIGLAMALAGCAGARIVPEPTKPLVVVPPPPRPVSRPISPGLPQDVERHRVALLVPLSGPNEGFGKSLANATQLAILDTKSENVRITTYDTTGGAAAAAQKAIADGNRLILGPLLAEEAREVAPIARAAHVPVLSFSNDSTAAGNGTYLLGHSSAQSIDRVVNYAKSTGITQFVGLVPNGVYGERVSAAFLRAVERAGGSVVALETFEFKARIAHVGDHQDRPFAVPGSADRKRCLDRGLRRAAPPPFARGQDRAPARHRSVEYQFFGRWQRRARRRLVRERARHVLPPLCCRISRAFRPGALSLVDARL